MIKKLFIYFVIFIISASSVLAENYKISGRVLDAKTNEPLIGVNILITQTKLGTVTDVNGNFILNNLKEGQYNLRFSYLGYSTIN